MKPYLRLCPLFHKGSSSLHVVPRPLLFDLEKIVTELNFAVRRMRIPRISAQKLWFYHLIIENGRQSVLLGGALSTALVSRDGFARP